MVFLLVFRYSHLKDHHNAIRSVSLLSKTPGIILKPDQVQMDEKFFYNVRKRQHNLKYWQKMHMWLKGRCSVNLLTKKENALFCITQLVHIGSFLLKFSGRHSFPVCSWIPVDVGPSKSIAFVFEPIPWGLLGFLLHANPPLLSFPIKSTLMQ